MKKLTKAYFLQNDVVALAKDLIGKVLCTNFNNTISKVIISETEAYAGVTDKASHAYGNRFTKRTQTMFKVGGIAYVYLCYGIHHLFNVVTNVEGIPHAVLIRGGIIFEGESEILKRRKAIKSTTDLLIGPGKLSQGLGINIANNNLDLIGNTIWIEDRNSDFDTLKIEATPRIGIDYAQEDALLPYRFLINPKYLTY